MLRSRVVIPMGEKGRYGLKINSYVVGSVYEVALGVREMYDQKPAFVANSLFLDFLKENGLDVYKGASTRDIICLDFSYGSASYEDTVKRIKKKRDQAEAEKNAELVAKYDAALERVSSIKDKFDKKSRERLREIFYRDGCSIFYPVYDDDGNVCGREEIKYRRCWRTPGKAKKGLCMFIREELHETAMNFLYMGLTLPEHNAPIVEIGAYSSLITSTIEDRITIEPENVLILKDVDVPFMTNVISIEIDEYHQCQAIPRSDYQLKNTLFDGQALIDESIFPAWASGYILLRHHFTKCAAFCTRIQRFFKDYCRKNNVSYENFQVFDMFGNAHLARDIKMITTDNALKWLKFRSEIEAATGGTQSPYEYWSGWVRSNGSNWGIVKSAHESKLGNVQRMSYQMVNALDIDQVPSYVARSVEYVERLKQDDAAFLDYLDRNKNFSNDYEVLKALAEWNPEFKRTNYYRSRRERIIRSYTKHINNGRIIQNADNLVIVGSPYAMLLHTVGEDPTSDPTFEREPGAIQCWTARFKHDEYLAEFRSPFNGRGNLGVLHNVFHEYFEKYFNFGRLIIAVNLNGSDFCDRNNGSDMDSDQIYTTNQPEIVQYAQWCYENYPTTVNNVPMEKNHYNNTPEDFALVDNGLAHSQRNIGESSNLAQVALSYETAFGDQKYTDSTYVLAVLAQLAIDSAKRRFDIDITSEIKRIKDEIDVKNNGYPEFWLGIRKGFNTSRINYNIRCPMNEVYKTRYGQFQSSTETIPLSDLFSLDWGGTNGHIIKTSKRVRELINKYSLELNASRIEDNVYGDAEHAEYLMALERYDEFIADLRQVTLGKKYKPMVLWLLKQTFCNRNVEEHYKGIIEKTRPLLMKVLYDVNKEDFLECFKRPKDWALTIDT